MINLTYEEALAKIATFLDIDTSFPGSKSDIIIEAATIITELSKEIENLHTKLWNIQQYLHREEESNFLNK